MSLQELEDHLVACQTCREDVAAIRQAATELRAQAKGAGPKTDQCLDEFAVVELVHETVDPDRRAAMLVHLASCPTCRSEVAALSRLTAAPAIRGELEATEPTRPGTTRRRFARVAGTIGFAAAAAAVAFLLVPRLRQVEDPSAPDHRAPVLTLSAPPEAIAPVGAAEMPVRFVWTSVPRADRYALTLFDRAGTMLWEFQTPDTVAVVPDSVALSSGLSYFWKVEARTDFDRWSESGLVEFIPASRPRGVR